MKRKLLFAIAALLCSVGSGAVNYYNLSFDLTGRPASDWSSISPVVPATRTYDVAVNNTGGYLLIYGWSTGDSGVSADWNNCDMAVRNLAAGAKVKLTLADAGQLANFTLNNSTGVTRTESGNVVTITIDDANVNMIELRATSTPVVVTKLDISLPMPATYSYDLTGLGDNAWKTITPTVAGNTRTYDVAVNGSGANLLVWGWTTGAQGVTANGNWLAVRNLSQGDVVDLTFAEGSSPTNVTLNPADVSQITSSTSGQVLTTNIVANRRLFELTPTASTTISHMSITRSKIDFTSFIKNPDLSGATSDKLSGISGWDVTRSNSGSFNGNSTVVELWNNTFDVNQTITNIPNGLYTLSVKASSKNGNKGELYATSNGTEYKQSLTMTYDQTGSDKFATIAAAFIKSHGSEYRQSVQAYVQDGTLKIGIRQNASYDGNTWIIFDDFSLAYVTPALSALSVPFTSGSTMEADQWYSFTVPTDGDYELSASDGIVYAVEDQLVSDDTNAAASTIALKAGTAYFKSTSSQAVTITYSSPVVENGEYYLYDATNKLFLSRGADYGSRATVDKYGVPFTWNNYSKMIEFKDWPGVHMFFDQADHTNCWLYTDGASNRGDHRRFAFEETTGGYFLRDLAKLVYLKHDGNVLTVPTTSSASATVWTILTKAQRDEIVNAYFSDNKTNVITAAALTSETDAAGFETWLATNRAAKDKTSMVGTAKFEGEAGDWTWTKAPGAGNPAYGTNWTEAFQGAVGTWSQTITGLPKGVYKVTVNAFERAAGFALCNSLGDEGYEPVTAYFKANNEQVQLVSWHSEKTGTNNPNDTGQAATAFDNDKFKNVLYTYVGDDGNLTIIIGKPSKADGSWVLFNNVTLTYYDTNVDDDDATAILAEATTAMSSPMKASLYQALATAKETFEGAYTVPNYSALRTAIDNTETSITAYANMYANYLSPIATYLTTTNFIDESSVAYTEYAGYKDAYENYTEVGTADVENATANALTITSGGGTNYTSTYSKLLLPNWTINGNAALSDGSGFYVNTWSVESDGVVPAADFANPFYEKWVGSGSIPACTLVGTLTGLAANTAYDITANVRIQYSSKVDGSITMEVEGGLPIDVTTGDRIGETNRYIKSYTATGVTDGSGNLALKFNVADNSGISWLSFRDVNYATSEAAISNDFTALNTKIAEAEAHALGFEVGDYAPYTNVEALEALAEAKSFDQERYYIPAVITAAATAITGLSWTENDAELNAFFDGDFSECAEDNTSPLDYTPNGWTTSSNMRMMLKNAETYPGLADASASSALMSWSAGITYGESTGYEMPLKANSIYHLSFKAAGWNNESRSGITVSVLNSADGMAATNLGTPDRDIKGNATNTAGMTSYEVLFATGAAGNYVFHIQSGHNFVITDLSLVKAASQTLSLPSAINYAAGTYPNVALNRTFASTDNWYTLCVPFAFDKNDFAAVKELDAITVNGENVAMSFADASTIVAGKPYLVKPKTANYDALSATDVDVVTSVEKSSATADGYTVKYVGTYAGTTVNAETAGGNAFVVKNNGIYHVNSDVSVGAYRAYFTVEAETPVKALIFDFNELPTAINAVEAAQNEKAEIYNLAGQRLNKAQKGVNIINGKKVLVK